MHSLLIFAANLAQFPACDILLFSYIKCQTCSHSGVSRGLRSSLLSPVICSVNAVCTGTDGCQDGQMESRPLQWRPVHFWLTVDHSISDIPKAPNITVTVSPMWKWLSKGVITALPAFLPPYAPKFYFDLVCI